jgi:hypothetical protein
MVAKAWNEIPNTLLQQLVACLLDVNQFLLMMDIQHILNYQLFSCPIILSKTYPSKNNYMLIDVKFFVVSEYCIIFLQFLLHFQKVKKITFWDMFAFFLFFFLHTM